MNYVDGTEIDVGDRVVLDGGDVGTVVMCLDSEKSVPNFNLSEWSYLQSGVMVQTDAGALVQVRKTVNSKGSVMIDKM
ncbi:hypothetical protein [Yoonia sp. 2307UL14-13]|uniref:hypothetical protein n=1 Tax=Yoonia sp. 2307UL14-13 TaxID=3126506 RepID=UPI0030A562F3